jgi:hypothetical protein
MMKVLTEEESVLTRVGNVLTAERRVLTLKVDVLTGLCEISAKEKSVLTAKERRGTERHSATPPAIELGFR